jgi:hypothetical protein
MQPFSLAAVLVLVTASVLGAASPPKVDTQKPAGADPTIPTITGLTPAIAPADAEEGATNILLLPGELRSQAAEAKAEEAPAKAEVAPPKPFVAPAPASHFRSQAANMSLPEPQVPRAPESAILARSTVGRSLTDVSLDRPSPLRRDPPPQRFAPEMERDPALYLQRQLGLWRIGDARKVFGEPTRQRAAYDAEKAVDGQVYAFADPTGRYRELELDFAQDTGAMRAVYVYPWSMKWDDCRKLWGANVTAAEASNGRKFFSYENRRLDVLVDRAGKVISLGLY